MKQLKKTILTLVALLAVTTGAWATEFTSLKVGDVLHVGDAINTGTNYKVYGLYLDAGYQPATLVRANIGTNDITESETGAYYLIKGKNDFYFGIIWGAEGLEGGYWPVTDTSDGISVTAITPGDYTELTFAVHEGTATPVDGFAWDAATKTGTFKQPAGNVTVSVEYYDQATLAFKGLTAAVDAAAKTEAPLAVLADGAVTGGTLMYYVATDKNFSQADAIALAETQWSAAIPTAETIEAAGTYIMWYYIKGDAEHSDTDPVPLAVTLLPAPTYAVTFAEGTDPNEWTASPATGVTKGQTVTVTYTGSKKVIGVKAEKKAAAKTLSEATLEDIGKIAGADGNIYDTKAAAEAVATGNAVAMIAYVGSASDCTHGLAIALADESGTKTWSAAGAACSGKTAVTGGTWRLPSIKDWQYMFIGCGASGSYSDSPNTMSYSELATKLTTANGTALQTASYWSSTESYPGEDAWSLYFEGSSASFFSGDYEGGAYPIRACLAF